MALSSRARPRAWSLLFVVLVGGAVLALVGAFNRGPIYFFDTMGYLRNGSVGLEKVLGIPAAAPLSEERDPANPAPAVGEDANVKWGNRSIYYGVALALGDLFGAMSLIVLAQGIVAAWVLFLCWRILGPPGAGAFGFLGLCLLLVALTPLGLFVAYLMPDLLYALVLPAVPLLLLCRDRLSRRESAGLVLVIAAACLSHGAAILLALGLLVLGLLAAWLVARMRIPWTAAALVLLACAIGGAGTWAVGKATERAFGMPALWPPFILARVLADGPGTLYLQEECARDPARFTLCRYVQELPPETADHFLWEMDSGIGTFVRATNAEQRAIIREQWQVVIPAVLARPGMQIAASVRNTLAQLSLNGIEEFAWHERLRRAFGERFPSQLDEINRTRLAGTGHGWVRPVNWTQGIVLLLGLAVMLARLGAPALFRAGQDLAEERREAAWILLLLGGLLVNAVASGALAEPHSRYGARLAWALPFAALLLLGRRAWVLRRREALEPRIAGRGAP